MKLRFSNGKNFAITFNANDLKSLQEQALSTLRSFRISTERHVHQGEIKKTRSWFENPELHVYSETYDAWLGLGILKHINNESSVLNGAAFHDPFVIRFTNQADSLEQIFDMDRELFDRSADLFWSGVVGTWEWRNAINTTLMQFDDDLRRYTDKEKKEEEA